MTLSLIVLIATIAASAAAQEPARPELLEIRSGTLTLRAQLWRPVGKGPFPAVLFNHGSYGSKDRLEPSDVQPLGALFARHGYVFLCLYRQGIALSQDQGIADLDQMERGQRADGIEGRNRVQLELLEHEELSEARAALERLRRLPEVDVRRIALVGHSFGGSLSLLMAARDPAIRAVVSFSAAAASWDQSQALRENLFAAVAHMSAAALFIHAQNDYSTASGPALAAAMKRLGKPHELKIYPPFGADSRAGHNLVFRSVATWESDVFAFLDSQFSDIARAYFTACALGPVHVHP